MKDPQRIGMNRTGIAMSPIDTSRMTAPTEAPPPPAGGEQVLFAFRGSFMRSADSIGTVPLPGSVKGAATTVLKKLKGDRPEVFLDMLGERIAFERTGTRLYDLLLNKCRERPADLPGVPLSKLEAIRDEELSHFRLTSDVMEQIGGDPTAVTPAADVGAVMAMGLVQALADPRTTVPQVLNAILLAELADNDAWPLLIQLAQDQDMDEVVREFRQAEVAERRHLAEIRALVAQAVLGKEVIVH